MHRLNLTEKTALITSVCGILVLGYCCSFIEWDSKTPIVEAPLTEAPNQTPVQRLLNDMAERERIGRLATLQREYRKENVTIQWGAAVTVHSTDGATTPGRYYTYVKTPTPYDGEINSYNDKIRNQREMENQQKISDNYIESERSRKEEQSSYSEWAKEENRKRTDAVLTPELKKWIEQCERKAAQKKSNGPK